MLATDTYLEPAKDVPRFKTIGVSSSSSSSSSSSGGGGDSSSCSNSTSSETNIKKFCCSFPQIIGYSI